MQPRLPKQARPIRVRPLAARLPKATVPTPGRNLGSHARGPHGKQLPSVGRCGLLGARTSVDESQPWLISLSRGLVFVGGLCRRWLDGVCRPDNCRCPESGCDFGFRLSRITSAPLSGACTVTPDKDYYVYHVSNYRQGMVDCQGRILEKLGKTNLKMRIRTWPPPSTGPIVVFPSSRVAGCYQIDSRRVFFDDTLLTRLGRPEQQIPNKRIH